MFTKTEQFDTLKNDYEFINKEVISIFDDNHKDDSSNDKIIFLIKFSISLYKIILFQQI